MNNPLNLKLQHIDSLTPITRGALAKLVFAGFDGEFDFALPESFLENKPLEERWRLISECVTAYPQRGPYRYGVIVNMISGELELR